MIFALNGGCFYAFTKDAAICETFMATAIITLKNEFLHLNSSSLIFVYHNISHYSFSLSLITHSFHFHPKFFVPNEHKICSKMVHCHSTPNRS